VRRAHQQQRIQVLPVAVQPPVQAGRRRARRVPGGQCAQPLAPVHHLPGAHHRYHRLVTGPQTPAVLDRHHAPVGQRPRVQHRARPGGEHGLADGADQVDAPVPGPVWIGGRLERPCDRGHGGQRPPEPGHRSGRGEGAGGGRGHRHRGRRWRPRGSRGPRRHRRGSPGRRRGSPGRRWRPRGSRGPRRHRRRSPRRPDRCRQRGEQGEQDRHHGGGHSCRHGRRMGRNGTPRGGDRGACG
jgi:hypothetical protein